jgi:type II secretory pathway component PulF
VAGVPNESGSPPSEPSLVVAEIVSAVDARLPLDFALRAAADEAESRKVERSLRQFAERIDRGEPADIAFAHIQHLLPPALATLMRASLSSGQISESLKLWMLEQQLMEETRREIRGAILYPSLVLSIAVLVVVSISMAFGAVFDSVYQEFGFKQSWEVRTTIWLARHGIEILIGIPVIFGVVLGVRWLLGPQRWNSVLSELPLIGGLWHWLTLARWARWLALLIDARLPLEESLRVAGETSGDFRIALASHALAARVEQGEPLSSAMADKLPWPATASLMVRWGEHSSTLADSLRGIATLYEGRLRLRRRWMKIALPMFAFLLVGFAIFFAYILLINPIVSFTSMI